MNNSRTPSDDVDSRGVGEDAGSDPTSGLDVIDPSRAVAGVERWRRALADAIGHDPGAAPLEPLQALALLKTFGSTRRLADLCLKYPTCADEALTHGPSRVIAEAARDISSLGTAVGGADAVHAALAPIKARTDLAIGLAELAGDWNASEAAAARADIAGRLVETSLAWLVRSAVGRGELTIDTADAIAKGVFIVAGGAFAREEITPYGALDLFIVYDETKFDGPAQRMAERAFVRIGSELRDAFEGKAGEAPIFPLASPLGDGLNGQGLVESQTRVAATLENPQMASFADWLSGARVAAGDRTAGAGFLETLEEKVWSLIETDSTETIDQSTDIARFEGLNALDAFAMVSKSLRHRYGAARPVFRTLNLVDAVSTAVDGGLIPHAIGGRLIQGHRLALTAQSICQLMKGATTTSVTKPDERQALAALMDYQLPDLLETALAGAAAEAINAATRITDGPQAAFTHYRNTDSAPDDAQKLEDLGFRDGAGLAERADSWAQHCITGQADENGEKKRFAAIAPGLLTSFGETQHPDRAIMLFDRLIRHAAPTEETLTGMLEDERLYTGLVDALGSFGQVVAPLAAADDAHDLFFTERGAESPRSSEEFVTRFPAPRDGEPAALADWRRQAIARVAYYAASGDISFDVAADAFDAISEIALARLFEQTAKANNVEDLTLYTLEGSLRRAPGHPTPLGFTVKSESPNAEETARQFLEALRQLGDGLFELTPDVSRRPGGGAGPLTSDHETLRRYIQSEAVASDHLMFARARVIAGPDEDATKVLRSAVANPRRTDLLFRDIDRARTQRLRRDRSDAGWDIERSEGGLHDTDLVISALIYRHAAAQPGAQTPHPRDGIAQLSRAGLVNAETARILIDAQSFYVRIALAKTLAGWSEPRIEPVRKRFANLLARAAGVSEFSAVRPLIRGHADEINALYSQLVLGRPTLGLVADA